MSQKKGVYSLKDAYMIYLAVEGIEKELQNEINKINTPQPSQVVKEDKHTTTLDTQNKKSDENVIIIPPVTLQM